MSKAEEGHSKPNTDMLPLSEKARSLGSAVIRNICRLKFVMFEFRYEKLNSFSDK